MTPVCILALDPGRKLGYCVNGQTPGDPITGVCALPRTYPDNGKAWSFLTTWLEMMVGQYGVTVLAWEAPLVFGGPKGSSRPTNADAIEFAYAFGGICEFVGERLGLICWKAPMGTVRLHFTGNGAPDPNKGRVYSACLARGYRVTSYDAADACAIWDFMSHKYRASGLVAGPLFADPSKVRSIRRPAPALNADDGGIDAANSDD
jgi:hypothetical protein